MPTDPDDRPAPLPEATEGAADEAEVTAVEDDESAVEEAARESFGLFHRDRLVLYDETAEAATDTALPFWAVLLLSGAIGTLGLVLNSTAVVIGAMLIAPLLGPLMGLSLALAVGDGRLAVQTFATIALGAAGVIALAALLTRAMPFDAVTAEIASRTRPTTLDLAVAVASGLAGAVVTASRRTTLSASIPGVAVAVALIPPLGVAGFGLGTGRPDVATGSLLLFGANLAGIVFSGLGVFLLIGMHRSDIVDRARRWHRTGASTGLAAWMEGLPLGRLAVFASPWARSALVLAFVALVAWPLSASLREVVRETRVLGAAHAVEDSLRSAGAVILDRDVAYDRGEARVRLAVAAPRALPAGMAARLTEVASRRAREPVEVEIERVLSPSPRPGVRAPPVRQRLAAALGALALPDSVDAVALTLGTGDPPRLRVAYTAPRRLSADAEAMIARQAAAEAGVSDADAQARRVWLGRHALPADSSAAAQRLAELSEPMAAFPTLRLLVVAPDSARARLARRVLAGRERARVQVDTGRGSAVAVLALGETPDPDAD